MTQQYTLITEVCPSDAPGTVHELHVQGRSVARELLQDDFIDKAVCALAGRDVQTVVSSLSYDLAKATIYYADDSSVTYRWRVAQWEASYD